MIQAGCQQKEINKVLWFKHDLQCVPIWILPSIIHSYHLVPLNSCLKGCYKGVQRVRENLHSKCLFVKKKTSTRVFVTVFVKICLLLTNTCACQELNNLKLTLKVVIKINNYENTQSEIRIFCLQSKVWRYLLNST